MGQISAIARAHEYANANKYFLGYLLNEKITRHVNDRRISKWTHLFIQREKLSIFLLPYIRYIQTITSTI